jgi:hypothetical protein
MGDVIEFPLISRTQARRSFRKFDVVVTTMPVMVRGRIVPRGSQGSIRDINPALDQYEFDFYRPFHCVVTLQRNQIR